MLLHAGYCCLATDISDMCPSPGVLAVQVPKSWCHITSSIDGRYGKLDDPTDPKER